MTPLHERPAMTNGRDHRIDFFRGLALIFILWDHIPQNPLGHFTLRNFGFSDAAEIFVFLAGYAAVLAYGKIALRDGYFIASVRILRRAWTLYVVHIFLLVLLMGIVFFANEHVETRDMVQEMGLLHFVSNPQQAMVDELLLRFKPNLMDPLPLYIVLLGCLPLALPILVKWPNLAVGLSALLYVPATVYGWNLSAYEGGGVWYFNPLAWQIMFVLGGVAALHAQKPALPDTRSLARQPLFVVSALYILAAGLIALGWKWPALHDVLVPQWLGERLYPISKTNLAPVRLLHFLALVYCTAKLLPRGNWVMHWSSQKLCLMGRYSLEVFCLSVLLAPMSDMVNALADDRLSMQLATAVGSAGLMLLLAVWLEFNKTLNKPPVPAPAPVPVT
jgi:hypothetical protein